MRAVQFDDYGDIDVLHVSDVPDPEVGAGEVMVRVRVAGINPGEAAIRSGAMKDMSPATFPSGQGTDLAGVVQTVGAGVTDVAVGAEVIGFSDNRNAQADLVAIAVTNILPKPAGMDWDVAGGLPIVSGTALSMIRTVTPRTGETVVVAGGGGGVGFLAVQLALRAGARVLATASEADADDLQAVGAEPVLYGDGVQERIQALTPNGVDAFLDTHGDGQADLAVALGVRPDRIDSIIDFAAGKRLGIKNVGMYQLDDIRAAVVEMAGLIAEGAVRLPVKARFPLDRVRDAYQAISGAPGIGKVVLDVST